MKIIIEKARREEIQDILEIYNYAVLHTTATFDTDIKTLNEMEQWFRKYENPLHPLLVAKIDDVIVGYGCLSPFKDKDAYKHTVENSIYIHPDYFGKGIATTLLKALITIGRKLNHKNIIAVITEGNDTSIHLHKKVGFQYKGTLLEMGYKWDRWLSIAYYQLVL